MIESSRGAKFVGELTPAEHDHFRLLCALMWVSRGDPMYAARISREFGPLSVMALRSATPAGNA